MVDAGILQVAARANYSNQAITQAIAPCSPAKSEGLPHTVSLKNAANGKSENHVSNDVANQKRSRHRVFSD